jgi:cell division protein FtsQ
MSAPASNNRKRPDSKRPSARVIDAPADPIDGDDSPFPGPATTTVRPPPQKASPARRGPGPGRLARTAQLVGGIAIALTASIGVGWGLHRYVMTSPRFAVRTVLVDGAHRRAATTITSEGGIAVGQNIYSIDLAHAGALITQDPWIERATVTRKVPSTITISVVEREAAALTAVGGELYLVTRDGELFKKVGADDPSDLPVVTGILPTQVATDRRGVVLAVKRALDVAEELDRSGVSRRYPIEELHLEKDGSLTVTVGREAIALSLGQPPYRDKIEEASRILTEVSRRKANASVVFLDDDAHPERVVVRMR